MGSYISSNANRFYAGIETGYGQAASVTAGNRFPAVRLEAQQLLERGKRLDKTGTRTFLGTSPYSRRQTAFEVRTYLTSWSGSGDPGYGSLVQAGFGGTSQLSSGLTIAAMQSPTQIQTATPHGLSVGSAVSYVDEIRFVTAVPNPATVVVNAPFSNTAKANAALSPTITYRLSTHLPSVTLYDYWDPVTAVSRLVTGAAVDAFELQVNGDFHELIFSGPAADLLDSGSFVAGSAGLSDFPTEPALTDFDYSIVPGHLGQVWLGAAANRVFTLTEASIELEKQYQRPKPGVKILLPESDRSRTPSSCFAIYSSCAGRFANRRAVRGCKTTADDIRDAATWPTAGRANGHLFVEHDTRDPKLRRFRNEIAVGVQG